MSEKVKQKFCTSIEECKVKHAEVIQDWTEFFRRVKAASPASDHDATVALMWKAHTTSIKHGESVNSPKYIHPKKVSCRTGTG